MNLEGTFFLWKTVISHTIKLSFDAETAERILKVIFYSYFASDFHEFVQESFTRASKKSKI